MNQIHVVVTAANVVINNIKIALGTNVIISHAVSGLTSGVQGTLDGSAYGTRARIGNLLASGPTAQISLGCLGTKGVLKQNEILQVQVPNVFAVGEVVDTAQGSISASVAIGETTSTVQTVDVLAGLVTADLIKADAHSMKNGGIYSFSDSDSKFVNLAVKGFANIDANVAPNTKLTIAGLGMLWLHRVIHSQNKIEVRMIELIVTQNNNLGLAIGTDIQVARAEASAH